MSSSKAATARPGAGPLDTFFKISQRGSTLGREVRGGLVTFFTMAYIVVLNPLIIGTQQDGTGKFLGGEGGDRQLPAVGVRPRAEDQRVQHDDVGHREERGEATADLPAKVRSTSRYLEISVESAAYARIGGGRRHASPPEDRSNSLRACFQMH